MSETIQKTPNMLAQDRTDMALERTMMAADRTLMAWTRTALSLISFGFTIYKFLHYMQEEAGNTLVIRNPNGPRNFGLTLIAIGVISLFVACIQHWHLSKKLNPEKKWHFSLSLAVAGFIVLLGLLALVNIIFKLGPF
jgi:putative membrane protein